MTSLLPTSADQALPSPQAAAKCSAECVREFGRCVDAARRAGLVHGFEACRTELDHGTSGGRLQRLGCVPGCKVGAADGWDVAKTPPPPSLAACPAVLPSDTRLWLVLDAPPRHGSTALFQLALSSRAVTSICTAMTWQCESKVGAAAFSLHPSRLPCPAPAL